MNTLPIPLDLEWTSPREVQTRYGPRLVRDAKPTTAFRMIWQKHQAILKKAGLSISFFRGEERVSWWQSLPKEILTERAATRELSHATNTNDINIPAPAGLEYLPYQKAGIQYASERTGVLIGDEMGLGKTIQALGVINLDPRIRTVLIICPASLRLNWAREANAWLVRPHATRVVRDGKTWPSINPPVTNGDTEVTIINYDVVSKHLAHLTQIQWDLLIVDEAHYLKNPKALRTKTILGSKKQPGIHAKRRVFLTGTPIVNRPIELHPLIAALEPNAWGNFWQYAKRYCGAHKTPYGWDFSGAMNLEELQARLRETIMVRRLKKDVLTELPPKRRQIIELPANGASAAIKREQKAWAAQQSIAEDLQVAVELAKASENPQDYVEAVQRLREGTRAAFTEISQARHDVALAKIPYVLEHLRNASGKVVVFAHHRDVIAALVEELGDTCVSITGDTPLQTRQAAVDRFQGDSSCQFFVGNIQAAGVGITLTASNHVVFAELDWVPGNLSQAEDRCHRIGQQSSVLVQHLVLEGSLDVNMARMIVSKQMVIDRALDGEVEELPVTPTKVELATADTKRDRITRIAKGLTKEQITAVHEALKYLAGMDQDHARELNGVGFSRIDGRIGHSLAECSGLTKRQAALGSLVVRKYHQQIPTELYGIIFPPKRVAA